MLERPATGDQPLPDPTNQLRAALADRYRLERELGQGGMATVYLAHDLKHDREVALKLLRPELGAVLGADRFLAEIKISAGLDHPHILTLIDSGAADGFLYYVMPYVRGETLRQRLTREKQLAIDEALKITRQVASALDYAHRKGVIHRDIKPENILLQEGEAVLADFGIALAVREAGGNRLTETGLSLGTPQYMSPEQATGDRALDARSDVYSLAAVLYEMLTGEPPVTGATAQAMIAKLMTERPTRVRTVRDTVPEAVDAAIAKALSKVPADRFATAAAFGDALGTGPATTATAPRRLPWVLGGTAVIIAAVATAVLLGRGKGAGAAPAAYAPDRQVTFSGDVGRLALAPDGRTVVYIRRDLRTLVLVDLDGGGSQTLHTAPKGAVIQSVDWSADGARILYAQFETGPQIWSIPKLGGEPALELDLNHLRRLNGVHGAIAPRGEWMISSEDRLYLGTDADALREDQGHLTGKDVITVPGQRRIQSAAAGPDGRWIAFSQAAVSNQASPFLSGVVSRDGKSGPGPVSEWSGLRVLCWVPDGSSVYLLRRAGNGWDLLRAPIDRKSGRPTAPPRLVYPRLQVATEAWQSQVAEARISADGRRLVFVSGPKSTRIRVLDLDGTPDPADNRETILSQGTAVWRDPVFLPDGRIAVASLVQNGYDILALSTGSSAPQSLTQRRGVEQPLSRLLPSPDGHSFALLETVPSSDLSSSLTLLTLPSGRTQVIPLPEPVSELAWSADGKRLGGMTAHSPDRAVTVDVAAGTARSVQLQCGNRCEFAWETIAVGPEWPWAAVTSQIDTWILNLETGALRPLAADTWTAVAWLGDWVYFIRQAGQAGQARLVLFRVRATGGREERLIDLPPDCEEPVTVSPDGKRVACAEVTAQQDIRVIDDFDAVSGSR
jgi:dipeptidyl aminopeptidase/acylaminoacyl peptidase